jgi:Family of unknown function (DUF6001)
MSTSLADLLVEDRAELVARRHRDVTAFLAQRELRPDWLTAFMHNRVGAGELLLTSSPVHGLANPSSDLDFIRIQQDAIDGPRISTKIFERGHHLEVVSFSAAELKHNLDELAALAVLPPADLVARYRTWDTRFEPRRKQTERIVNGLTLDGDAPYLSSLPALAITWSRASLQIAVEQVSHLCLAEAAGELRGRIGYAYNVLLHLMDSVLSMHGDVYTTRKWFLLRWRRFVHSGRWHDDAYRAVADGIEQARRALSGAFGSAEPIAPGYTDLVTRAAQATGAAAALRVATTTAQDAEYHGYLPGAGMLSAAGRSVLVPGPLDWSGDTVDLGELARVDAADAATRLRVLRAGIGRIDVSYQDRSAA